MSRVISPVTGKPYGLAVVCRVWRVARSGVYRHFSTSPPEAAQRRGPLGAMSDEALTTAIRGVLAARGASQALGQIVSCRDPHIVAPGAAADAAEQSAGSDAGGLAAGAAQPQRHDHPRYG